MTEKSMLLGSKPRRIIILVLFLIQVVLSSYLNQVLKTIHPTEIKSFWVNQHLICRIASVYYTWVNFKCFYFYNTLQKNHYNLRIYNRGKAYFVATLGLDNCPNLYVQV